MEAKIQSLEATIKHLQQEVTEYKTLYESAQTANHNDVCQTSTPIPKNSVPENLKFGKSATPSFTFPNESQNASQDLSTTVSTPELDVDIERSEKGRTDSSYFNAMMETMSNSNIEEVLREKPPPTKKLKKKVEKPKAKSTPKARFTSPIWMDVAPGVKIDTTILNKPKPTKKSHKILSPKSRPPVVIQLISPSATRSGHLYKQ